MPPGTILEHQDTQPAREVKHLLDLRGIVINQQIFALIIFIYLYIIS